MLATRVRRLASVVVKAPFRSWEGGESSGRRGPVRWRIRLGMCRGRGRGRPWLALRRPLAPNVPAHAGEAAAVSVTERRPAGRRGLSRRPCSRRAPPSRRLPPTLPRRHRRAAPTTAASRAPSPTVCARGGAVLHLPSSPAATASRSRARGRPGRRPRRCGRARGTRGRRDRRPRRRACSRLLARPPEDRHAARDGEERLQRRAVPGARLGERLGVAGRGVSRRWRAGGRACCRSAAPARPPTAGFLRDVGEGELLRADAGDDAERDGELWLYAAASCSARCSMPDWSTRSNWRSVRSWSAGACRSWRAQRAATRCDSRISGSTRSRASSC